MEADVFADFDAAACEAMRLDIGAGDGRRVTGPPALASAASIAREIRQRIAGNDGLEEAALREAALREAALGKAALGKCALADDVFGRAIRRAAPRFQPRLERGRRRTRQDQISTEATDRR